MIKRGASFLWSTSLYWRVWHGPNDHAKDASHLTILDGSVTVPDIVRFIETSHFQTLSKTGHEALEKELANINMNTKKQYDVIDVFSILPKIHNLK